MAKESNVAGTQETPKKEKAYMYELIILIRHRKLLIRK